VGFDLTESDMLFLIPYPDQSQGYVENWPTESFESVLYLNFHSVEILPRDVNCHKRHHSGSTLLHMRACAMGSQSPTSTTLSHF